MEHIISATGAQSETTTESPFEITDVGGVLGDFDERLEDLFWKEDDDRVLYAGDDRASPNIIVAFELVGAEIEASKVDVDRHDWRRFRSVSRPDQGASEPQFD